MNRQYLVRIVLSLLLLLSQQMAMSHVLSHWTGSIDTAQQAGSSAESVSSAFAKDQSCNQCLAFAQLASPVGSPVRTFAATEADPTFVASSTASALCARTVCVFQPRGPPQA